MKERPILFSAPMVRAILDDRKTQTRRIIKPQPYIDEMGNFCWNGGNFGQDFNGPRIQAIASPIPSSKTKRVRCPYGKPGDRLWVRETFSHDFEHNRCFYKADCDNDGTIPYLINGSGLGGGVGNARIQKWKPSIHMPRIASRILLEITGVRVERLQDISEEDAIAEGASFTDNGLDKWGQKNAGWSHIGKTDKDECLLSARSSFGNLFESINGHGTWDLNPYVRAIEFKRVNNGFSE